MLTLKCLWGSLFFSCFSLNKGIPNGLSLFKSFHKTQVSLGVYDVIIMTTTIDYQSKFFLNKLITALQKNLI